MTWPGAWSCRAPVPDFGFFAVGGAFGGTTGGVGAGGALPSFGVAVAGDEAGVAVGASKRVQIAWPSTTQD